MPVVAALLAAPVAGWGAAADIPEAVVGIPVPLEGDDGSDAGATWGGSAVVIDAHGLAITLSEALPGPATVGEVLTVVLPGGHRTHAHVVKTGATTTAVLLAIDHWTCNRAFTCADSREAALGAEAWTAGNAGGAIEQDGHLALSCGTISGLYDIPPDAPSVRGRLGRVLSTYRGPVLETDAGVNDGSQGGALVDARGHLLGLISLGQARERHLGTAVPIDAILQDLQLPQTAGPAASPPETRFAQAAANVRASLALIRFERPAGLGNPEQVPRPNHFVDDVPKYDRERLQRWWDIYYRQQQVFYTDQPSPALVIDPAAGLLITAASNLHGEATTGLVLAGDASIPCTVVAVNKPMDLALVRAAKPLPGRAVRFATRPATTAEEVALVALVRTTDRETLTLTRGVISAVGRRLAQSPHSWLQISARANYGSLGGALIREDGEILGMSVLLNPSSSWLINSGVAMALDGDEIQQALVGLRAGIGTDTLPIMGLGVTLKPLEEGHPAIAGIIPGTGAEAAGLKPGDVLEKIDGVPATSPMAIARVLLRHRLGDSVEVEYLRDGKAGHCPVALSEFRGGASP